MLEVFLMYRMLLLFSVIDLLPLTALARGRAMGPQAGDRELSLSGTGNRNTFIQGAVEY